MKHLFPIPKRALAVLVIIMMVVLPIASAAPASDDGLEFRGSPIAEPPEAVFVDVDAISTMVEVGPGETRVLRVDGTNLTLEPQDWYDPVEGLTGTVKQAVDRVEPWLKRDLAIQLRRLAGNADRFARVIVKCDEADWVDEIAFSIAHTPPEELTQVGDASVLEDNAEQLYVQDQYIAYADIVERTGEDGNYSTVRYLNWTGQWNEYPRDIYYWYLAHARVFWEAPAKVSGKSFWRKAYFEEITYDDSGTLKAALSSPTNIIEGINASTVWMQMNMEFGYGTNPLQPVQVILERYGSCGQYSITTAASLKVAMVPARVAIYPASDHQWCEVWHDGHWRHIDASNDVAGSPNVKEPELIRRTNSVNYNDAGVFERGWKPYMSAMSTFRSDDVVINSIDIVPPGPSFSMRESGMTESSWPEPHKYTNTSTVHLTIEDSQGDAVEAAYVAIYRVGHYVYDASEKDHPHFAYANYTDANGQVAFELGLQGYCGRCDKAHTYGALVLSSHYQGTGNFFEVGVPAEDTEYRYTFEVHGDAPHKNRPAWTPYVTIPPIDMYKVGIDMDVWGLQRHLHGEYGQYETFNFRTTFDHVFPSTIDVLVTDENGLERYNEGGVTPVHVGYGDVEHLSEELSFEEGEDTYILLSNIDSSHTTKVVNITANVPGLAYPRLAMDTPVGDTDHNTGDPLAISGRLWDHVPITSLEWSVDDGETWTDILFAYDPEDRDFSAVLDVTDQISGDHQLMVRATDDQGIWRAGAVDIFLDADDPTVEIVAPDEGDAFKSWGLVTLEVGAADNRLLDRVRVRMAGETWQDMDEAVEVGRFTKDLPLGEEVGPVTFEVEVADGVGRTNWVEVTVFSDHTVPKLEVDTPKPATSTVVGAQEDIEATGYVWDDYGVRSLRYQVDGGEAVDVTDAIDPYGEFTFNLTVSEWDEGEHDVRIEVEDLAGHTASLHGTVVRDATAPELFLYRMDPVYEDVDDVELEGTVTDEHGVAGLWVKIDEGYEERLPLEPLGVFFQSLPSGPEAVGNHTVRVRAMDELGNEVLRTISYQVVDLTEPDLAIEHPIIGTEVAQGSVLTISGTALDNVGVTVLWLRVGTGGEVDIIGDMDPIRGTWSTTVSTEGKGLGGLVIYLRAEDAAGNRDASSVNVVLIDGEKPEISMSIPPLPVPEGVEGGELVIPLEFTDNVGVARLEYRVDGMVWMPILCPMPCNEWMLTVPLDNVPAGSHVLEARVTDAKGNEAVLTTPFNVQPPDTGGLSAIAIAGIVGAVVLVVVLVLIVLPRVRPSPEDEPAPPIQEEEEVEVEPTGGSDDGDGDEPGEPEEGSAGPEEGSEGTEEG